MRALLLLFVGFAAFLSAAASKPEKVAEPLSKVEAQVSPAQIDPGCAPGKEIRSSDLCAQWKAADAAKESANWAGKSYFVTVAGTIIGLFTFLAAVAAAAYARKAAVAAKGQLTLTEDQHKRTIEPRLVVYQINAPTNPSENWLHINCRNEGFSPALNCEVRAAAVLLISSVDQRSEAEIWRKSDFIIDETCNVLPGEHRDWIADELAFKEMCDLRATYSDRVGRLVLALTLNFETEFGERVTIVGEYTGRATKYFSGDNNDFFRIESPFRSTPGSTTESRSKTT